MPQLDKGMLLDQVWVCIICFIIFDGFIYLTVLPRLFLVNYIRSFRFNFFDKKVYKNYLKKYNLKKKK